MDLVVSTVSQGLLWALLAIGVYLTFRVLDIADLTVEGSFPLGAAVAASLLTAGWQPIPAIFMACVAGMISGVVTGFLCTKLKIPALLAGILTMIALYSVNLRVMGKANLPLLQQDTIFTIFPVGEDKSMTVLIIGAVVVLLVSLACYWFFGTEIGAAVRATGNNPHMIRANGIDTDVMIVLGLLLSNGLVAISGALVAQSYGFADVGMGTGTIVSALASLMLGEFILRSNKITIQTLRVLIGSCIYRALMIVARTYGHYIHLTPNDLKLITGILIIICLTLTKIKIGKKK